jgi:outer membrane receptor protein involved in Fe transport
MYTVCSRKFSFTTSAAFLVLVTVILLSTRTDANAAEKQFVYAAAVTGESANDEFRNSALYDDGMMMQEITVRDRRPLTSASNQVVRDKDFMYLPRSNPSDLMRIVPGIQVTQHTGGAKAHQIFLRGFDAEHGQDLLGTFDGIPLNEPSQVHGHGYLDLMFLIPETLRRIEIIKGPYDARHGNFATAGALNFVPKTSERYNSISATVGNFASGRTFASLTDTLLSGNEFMIAADVEHTDGFTNPGWADAYRGFTSYQYSLTENSSLKWISAHYYQDSAAADVIPEDWVRQGKVDRFGTIDETDRVSSERHLIGLRWQRTTGDDDIKIQAYYNYKRVLIFSNYTFYYFNPVLGDQQEMYDNRQYFGVNASYTREDEPAGLALISEIGLQQRTDMVHQVLANTEQRERYNLINRFDFDENAIGLYLTEDIALFDWLRVVAGMRYDTIFYRGEGTQDEQYFDIYTNTAAIEQDAPVDWNNSADVFSPKLSLIFSPLNNWDLFANYGEGFFSNSSKRMAKYESSEIPKVRGGELGTRLFLFDDTLTLATALWRADKETDLAFDPTTGLSIELPATYRIGLDSELRYNPVNWFYFTTDFSYVRSRYKDSGKNMPNVPIRLMSNTIGLREELGWRILVRGRYMGIRELDHNEKAPYYYIFDLEGGYENDSWMVGLSLVNLFDTEWEDAVFCYTSRPVPQGEELTGIHWTPGSPLAAKFSVTAKF